jgi:hypothetical protein
MLRFGVTIPATVSQKTEIPEGLINYPVYNFERINQILMPATLTVHNRVSLALFFFVSAKYPDIKSNSIGRTLNLETPHWPN